jgi:3-deoxy-D-manno-octulosonic-acid transferase
MFFLYNLVITLASQFIKVLALFNPKIKLFVEGRKGVFSILRNKITANDKTIWFHAASLGEYEQGLPVIERIKENFPNYKMIVSFFSPSGYEVRKNNSIADVTIYLPLDTKQNATKFLELVHPEIAFFIKYEYWPNYLNELKKLQTKTYLISGVFRESQVFFKWYGAFYRKALKNFDYFFVQNENSKNLLKSIGFSNVVVSGDTRFDRVVSVLERDNSLDFIHSFTSGKKITTIVIGSSWTKDENLLINYINNSPDNVKFIIAPHNIKAEEIEDLKYRIIKPCVLFSEKNNVNLSNFNVFIIDTIGILTKIYSYADFAYVGGGFGNPGVHNILEPAVFGIPIVIGPNYTHFPEVIALVGAGGCMSISNQEELNVIFDNLIQNKEVRYKKGLICTTYVQQNRGATEIIFKNIFDNFKLYL